MRVPREVEKLVEEGASLSADGAAGLERSLEARPDDLDARARLLGYYRPDLPCRRRHRSHSKSPLTR